MFKTVREVHRKEPTLPQTKDSAVTESKSPPKVAVADDLGKTKLVHSVIEKRAYFCFENQSVDEARRIMHENDLQYLLVLDRNLRIVGIVRMGDLMLGDEDCPQSGGIAKSQSPLGNSSSHAALERLSVIIVK